MKEYCDKVVSIAAAVVLASMPFQGRADWLYDPGAKTISDGEWIFSVTEAEGELTLTKDVSGLEPSPAMLDLSAPIADAGGNPFSLVALGSRPFTTQGGKAGLVHVKLPETLRSIGAGVFGQCKVLETVEPFLPAAVEFIGPEAFSYCRKLRGNFKLANPKLKELKYWTFQYCNSLDSAEIPYIEKIGGNCFLQNNLTNLVLSPDLTTIDGMAFYGCPRLETVTPFLPPAITSLGSEAFAGCGKGLAGPVVFPEEPIDLSGAKKLFFHDAPLDFQFPRKAPIKSQLAPTVFEARNPSKTRRVLCGSLRLDPMGWDALTEPLTAEDRAREDFPGPKTFGVLELNGIRYFCVDYRSPLDPKGIILMVR